MATLQVWQCGGQVLIATCSRVGHVFRKVSPYSWPGGVAKILNHNTMRTVEVWMGNHKNFFYAINPSKVFFPKFYCGKFWSYYFFFNSDVAQKVFCVDQIKGNFEVKGAILKTLYFVLLKRAVPE